MGSENEEQMRKPSHPSLGAMSRRAWQGLTLWVIAIGSCAWWYVETQSELFLVVLLFSVLVGVGLLVRDLRAIRGERVDSQGLTTVVGRLTKSEDVILLFLLAFGPLAHRVYLALTAGAVIPPQPHHSLNAIPAWFTFSAVALCFAAWVETSREKLFWVIATVFFGTYGLWGLAFNWGSHSLLSQVVWGINNVAVAALAICGSWIYRKEKQVL